MDFSQHASPEISYKSFFLFNTAINNFLEAQKNLRLPETTAYCGLPKDESEFFFADFQA